MSVLKYKAPNGEWVPVGSAPDNSQPYDIATERVMLNYEPKYLKLTIDNLLDGHYESFQPFDMVCLGSDGYPMSSLCTVTVESYDSVKMLVYNTKSVADNLCPKYYTSEDGNVYLYFDADCEHLQVYIRGLVEKCTGATLEIVDALPDGAVGINIEKHLNEDYVSYTANDVTQKRPIGHAANPHSIVCRNSAAGIEVRSLASGQTYADNEAVPFGYIRDTMLPNAGGGGGGNANIDVTAEVGQTIIVKEVDENGKPTKWESADYQPRIAWTDETGSDIVTIAETTVKHMAVAQTLPCVNDFKAGHTYDVYINDDVLPLVAQAHAGGVVLGNYEKAGAPDSVVHLTPNCPIGIWWEGPGATSARVWVARCVETAQFKVIERRSIAYNPINSKLLPDSAALAYDVDKLPKYWAQVEELFGNRETVLLNHTCYAVGALGHKVTFVVRRMTSGVSSLYTGYAVDMPYHLLFSIRLNGDVDGCTIVSTDYREFGLAPPSGTAYGAVATYTGSIVEWKVPSSSGGSGEPTLIDLPEEYIVDGVVIPIDTAGLEEILVSYESSGFNALIQTGTETSVTHIRILYLNLDAETHTVKIKCVSPSTGDIVTLTFVVEE